MEAKDLQRPNRKARSLKVQTIAPDKAKRIKGGPCPGTNTRLIRSGW